MGQSLSQLYVHLTFGTKKRYPFISGQIEPQLHSYLGGILKNKECPALKINSVPRPCSYFVLIKKYDLIEYAPPSASLGRPKDEKYFWS